MTPPTLTLDHVTLRFDSGFQVGPATRTLGLGTHYLWGPNGAGKTTLLRGLCGGLPLAAGTVWVNGRDVHRDPAARRDIALVPATPELPDFLTVDEAWQHLAVLRGAPQWDGEPLRRALALPGRLPLAHASSGQRRRAELLAALAGDPPVLLMDETFAHLDTEGVALLASWLEAWRTERILVFTHHGDPPVTPTDSWRLDAGSV